MVVLGGGAFSYERGTPVNEHTPVYRTRSFEDKTLKETDDLDLDRLCPILASSLRGMHPHGGVRPFHQKLTCTTQLTLGPSEES